MLAVYAQEDPRVAEVRLRIERAQRYGEEDAVAALQGKLRRLREEEAEHLLRLLPPGGLVFHVLDSDIRH